MESHWLSLFNVNVNPPWTWAKLVFCLDSMGDGYISSTLVNVLNHLHMGLLVLSFPSHGMFSQVNVIVGLSFYCLQLAYFHYKEDPYQ
jgi:hypothetical protein